MILERYMSLTRASRHSCNNKNGLRGDPLKRDQFTFYRSYYEALKHLPKKDRADVLMAVIGYISIRYQKGWVEKFQLRREKKRTKNAPN